MENATTKEFLLLPLLTAISHLTQHSKIKALKNLEENGVFYSVLVASPSTGKSPAMNIVRKALYDLEEYLKTPPEKSLLINGEKSFFFLNFNY